MLMVCRVQADVALESGWHIPLVIATTGNGLATEGPTAGIGRHVACGDVALSAGPIRVCISGPPRS